MCHTNSVRHIAVTTTGNQLVTGGEDGDVKVWSIAGLPLASLENASKHDPSLALQKIVHTGRGRINNLAILRTDREALSDADREIEEVIAPFSQDFSNPLNTEINIPLRGKGKPQPQHLDIFNFATDPCFDSVEPEKGPDYKNELEESVISLQENNKDLYNFAMKQILKKTPKGGKGGSDQKTNNKGKKASANKNRYFDNTKQKKYKMPQCNYNASVYKECSIAQLLQGTLCAQPGSMLVQLGVTGISWGKVSRYRFRKERERLKVGTSGVGRRDTGVDAGTSWERRGLGKAKVSIKAESTRKTSSACFLSGFAYGQTGQGRGAVPVWSMSLGLGYN
ncbi:uncharacterized protein LOC134788667 [Penaeus indicus]|uniref:uncharacterized protein LOC134788667 n=1 Tax=Penaeus indicus TaxID=29960 RepID=UPI00300C9998